MVNRETRSDRYFMELAVKQAEVAIQANEVPVGCVFVRNNKVIAFGFNETNSSLNGTRHCEFVAIDKILKEYSVEIFAETVLYVTVEPCIMCAAALKIVGIKRVVFGCGNYRFGGNGSVLSLYDGEGGYEVVSGVMKDTAIKLLQNFYEAGNPAAPFPHRRKKTSSSPASSLLSTFLWYMGSHCSSFSLSLWLVFSIFLDFLLSCRAKAD